MRIHDMDLGKVFKYSCLGAFLLGSMDASALDPNTVSSYKFPSGTPLKNGSFENSYSAFSFEGWNPDPDGASSAGGILPVANGTSIQPYSGYGALALDFKVTQTNLRAFASDPFPVTPDTWYTFFLKVRTANYAPVNDGQKTRPIFQTYRSRDVAPEHQGTEEEAMADGFRFGLYYPPPSASWAPYYHRFKTGPSAHFATIGLVSGSTVGSTATLFFDDAFLAQGCVRTSASDLLAGCPAADNVPFGKDGRHPDFLGVSRGFYNGSESILQTQTQDGDRDIISASLYDPVGRASRTTLPIAADFASARHQYQPGINATFTPGDLLANFYNPNEVVSTGGRKTFDPRLDAGTGQNPGPAYPDAGGIPYSERNYEASSLARVTEAAMPGTLWKMGSGHTSKTKYSSVSSITDGEVLKSPAASGGRFYVLESTFPNGNRIREFKDQGGRLVRRSIPIDKDGSLVWVNTDYFYDANDDLVRIQSPAGEDGIRNVVTMEYDDLHRVVAKSSTSAGRTTYLYDDLGRLRFSRTPNQLASGRFGFTRYDNLGRAILSGEVQGSAYFGQEMADKQEFPCTEACSDATALLGRDKVFIFAANQYDASDGELSCSDAGGGPGGSSSDGFLFVTKSPSGTGTACSEDLVTTYRKSRASLSGQSGHATISAIFDPEGNRDIEPPPGTEIDFIDGNLDYSLEGVSKSSPDGISAKALYDACQSQESSFAAGNLKGRLAKTLACNPDLSKALGDDSRKRVSTTFEYDKYGNILQSEELNEYVVDAGLRKQTVLSEYDISNRLQARTACGDAECSPALAHVEKYEYDRLGRLARVSDKNGGIILENHFDFLGRPTARGLGGNWNATAGTGLVQSTNYHLHGSPLAMSTKKAGATNNLFREELKYEAGDAPRYDGLISGAAFQYDGNSTLQNALEYGYQYDDLSRLTEVSALPLSAGAATTYDYQDDGRLAFMQIGSRVGNYFFNAQSQLDHVQGDLVEHRSLGLPNTVGYVFKYDPNGNLIQDYSKAFAEYPLVVKYHGGDQPYEFDYHVPGPQSSSSQAANEFAAYNSAGARSSKIDKVGGIYKEAKAYFQSGSEVREKAGANPVVYFSLGGAGRIRYSLSNPGGERDFYISDHLGSVREVYAIGAEKVSYASNYHPHGDQFAEYIPQGTDEVTPKYTGKEKDGETRLQYFGARYYDPELSIWISPDPAMQFHNPYSTGGSPVNSVDPDGLAEYVILNEDGTVFDTWRDANFSDRRSLVIQNGKLEQVGQISPQSGWTNINANWGILGLNYNFHYDLLLASYERRFMDAGAFEGVKEFRGGGSFDFKYAHTSLHANLEDRRSLDVGMAYGFMMNSRDAGNAFFGKVVTDRYGRTMYHNFAKLLAGANSLMDINMSDWGGQWHLGHMGEDPPTGRLNDFGSSLSR